MEGLGSISTSIDGQEMESENLISLSKFTDEIVNEGKEIFCTQKFYKNVIQSSLLDKEILSNSINKKKYFYPEITYHEIYSQEEWLKLRGVDKKEFQRAKYIFANARAFFDLKLSNSHHLHTFSLHADNTAIQYDLSYKQNKFVFDLESEV